MCFLLCVKVVANGLTCRELLNQLVCDVSTCVCVCVCVCVSQCTEDVPLAVVLVCVPFKQLASYFIITL